MRIVVIGNGVAGNSAASIIKRFDRDAAVTIISDESFPLYSACALHHYLGGDIEREKVFLKSHKDYSNEGINTIFGQQALSIDVKSKRVALDSECISYDRLIIATGSKPLSLPIEGTSKKGVFTFKTLADVERISREKPKRVVVIGAGNVALDAAISLHRRGRQVFLLVRSWISRRAFDKETATLIQNILENNGIKVLTGTTPAAILGESKVEAVATNNGDIDCDTVILAVGMEPRVEMARQSGLEIGELGGIKTNEHMMTSIEDVYACGDCIQSQDMLSGKPSLSLLWPSAKQQGEVAGFNCVNIPNRYPGSINIISRDVFGTCVSSFGSLLSDLEGRDIDVIEKTYGSSYYRILVADGVPVGGQFVGNNENMGVLLAAARKKVSIDRLRQMINTREFLSLMPSYGKIGLQINH